MAINGSAQGSEPLVAATDLFDPIRGVKVMPEIKHQFPIDAPNKAVFEAISTPAGLDSWWTLKSDGRAEKGAEYRLYFGDRYDWRAVVSRYSPASEFELTMTVADDDWLHTRVAFDLEPTGGRTEVRFRHSGWPEANDHFSISSFCWAMYLRLLKRYVESGEVVSYGDRLNV